jgi:spore coat polysaccharide biosynthesis protein SpsF (cytidylyltransferase family)
MKTINITKNVIIICRLNSKRLKNKALKKYNNKSLIEHLISNILKTKIKKENIIISTSTQKSDDKLSLIAKKLQIKIFRGSKKNIINRIYKTYKKFKIQNAIITSADNPFFLDDVYKKIVRLDNYSIKYTTSLPVGLNMLNCNFRAINEIEKRNLTKNNENGFYLYFTNTNFLKKKSINLKINKEIKNARFTIDYIQDFLFFKKLLFLLKKNKLKLSLKNINKIVKDNIKIKQLNQKEHLKYKENLKIRTKLYYLDKNNKRTFLPYV